MAFPYGHCSMCGRRLSVSGDPLSSDCGGDCWGCIGVIEAEAEYEPSIRRVKKEIEAGYRLPNGQARPFDEYSRQLLVSRNS